MVQIDIRKLVNRPKGTEVRLAPINERVASVIEYRTVLRRLLREIAAEIRLTVIPAYQAHRRDIRLTQDDESWFEPLRRKRVELTRVATQMVRRILDLETQRHTDTFMRSAKAALGIDLAAVIRQEDLEDYLRDALARNASLITSLADDTIKRIEQTVYAAKIEGRSAEKLRKELQDVFKIPEKRARLIARDQTSKLNSDLNSIRQQQIGIKAYRWMTSADERVRPLHKRLNNRMYEWGKPTDAEEGLPPGKPVQCRCVAIGVVFFDDDEEREVNAELASQGKLLPLSAGENRKSTKKPKKQAQRTRAKASPKPKSSEIARVGAAKSEPKAPPHEAISKIKKKPIKEKAPEVQPIKVQKTKNDQQKPIARLREKLTSEEEAYLDFYNGDGFLKLNSSIREGSKDKSILEMAKSMDSAISKSELVSDAKLFRGVKHAELYTSISKDSVGKSITMNGFQSTTTSRKFAEQWGGRIGKFGTGDSVVFEIRAKKGQKALFTNLASEINQHEQQVILPSGLKYKVVEVEELTGTKTVVLEIEDHAPASFDRVMQLDEEPAEEEIYISAQYGQKVTMTRVEAGLIAQQLIG